MKNIIPLITAVLLGLAAVFAVSRTLKQQDKPQEKMRQVLIVTSSIAKGELILENKIAEKSIPESAAPKNCIDAASRSYAANQRATRPISKGDYLLYMDIELDQSKSKTLGDGQWGVPVKFADGTLLKMLRPGDDIAIIGTFSYQEQLPQGKNADSSVRSVTKSVTAVVYPRVSILEINGGTVLLSMPPRQAIALTAIQQKAALYPLLRKKNDEYALNRKDGGKFEDSALTAMLKDLDNTNISIPLSVADK